MNHKLLFATAALGLVACSGEEQTEELVNDAMETVGETTEEGEVTNEFAEFEFEMAVANMPSPVEHIDVLQHHDHLYNKALVAPLESADKFVTTGQKAIGFGMYMVDLSYMAETGHTESMLAYFNTAHKLAGELGAAESFEAIVGDLMEGDQPTESIHSYVEQGYGELEGYLTSDEHLATASALLIGSWLEGQYIVTHMIQNVEHEEVREHMLNDINDQKLHLDNLLGLMNALNDGALSDHIAEFEKLHNTYHSFADASELTPEIIVQINSELETLRASFL